MLSFILFISPEISKAQGSQWIIDDGFTQFSNGFLKNNISPLTTSTGSFLKVGQGYVDQNFRTYFYGGNVGISQDEDTFGHFKGKWSFTGKYSKHIGSNVILSVPNTYPGFNYLINYHRWGDYSAHFGLRSSTTTLEEGEVATITTDSDLKHAVITWGYEIDSTPNRLIFQSVKGVDHQGINTVHNETEVMTILHSGHLGLGISEPLSQFTIKPISGKSYNSALSILNSNEDVKVTIDHTGLLEIVGTDSLDMFNLFSEHGANILKVKDSTITTRAYHSFHSAAGTVDSVSFFSLLNQSSDTLLSMSAGGTLTIPALSSADTNFLMITPNGKVISQNPYYDVFWNVNGNNFGGNPPYDYVFGTESNHNIILKAGGWSYGKIYGWGSNAKGWWQLGNHIGIGGNHTLGTGYQYPDTGTTLSVKSTDDDLSDGIFRCLNHIEDTLFEVSNGIVSIWPNSSTAGWTFLSNITVSKGDIIPINSGTDNIGDGTYFYNGIYSDKVYRNTELTLSDKRAKKEILSLPPTLQKVVKLNPVSFKYLHRPENERKVFGFIAQDVLEIFPELIEVPKNEKDQYRLFLTEMIPILTKAIQEQQLLIDSLDARLNLFASLISHNSTSISSNTSSKNIPQPLLFQNHPNPTPGKTYVDFYIPEAFQNAFLKLTDQNGKLKRAFSIHSVGFGQIDLDLTDLESGNYYYSLIINESTIATRKLILTGW